MANRILIVNKFYYSRGGDCIYTMNLEKLLKAKGHEVAVYAMQYPENEQSEWSCYWPANMTGLRAVVRPFGVRQVVRGFSRLIDDFRPDVVHLNNIHSQLSPVIAEVAHSKGVRVVWT
ncbi:MAG: glycosyltransferase, partial [Muribaculaceae bacterium]|nr:glycosyltransferase [Muribaculaceae bacterium]